MQTVTHHGRTTAYRTFDRGGDGHRLLAVHGSGGSHRIWTAQSAVATDHPVVALDLSGHGESDDVSAEPGYETLSAYVDDVVAVAEAAGGDVLLGNSLGGAVALTALVERDLDVSGAVLAGVGPRLPVPEDLLEWVSADFPRAVEFLHRPDHLFHDADKETLNVSRAALRQTGSAVLDRDLQTAHGVDLRGQLSGVDVPVLALVGAYDRLTPPYYHEELCEELSECEVTAVDGAAHLAMLEVPAAFNRELSGFLSRA
ncbi:carboxylesterase [Halobellus salinus]|uniref:Carboxylesterase n=1 Tax=Halobellus salinus TaxID=931585 RepID=A0A830EAB8_9EURY|nr:alpha/beta fold hydrolase [Halobellus salinus]GGJ06445.1 carboxylesterase [Halobellus salinus]SMP14771.1 Pimeloyl-ACP methyl ester carboxylesterase [Halobellus salinus]